MSQNDTPYTPASGEIEAFFKAIEVGDSTYVRDIVVQHPDAVNWRYDAGFVPLQWAFMEAWKSDERAALADFLIDNGADPNAQLPNGSPLLVDAIVDAPDKFAVRLVEAGADISWKSPGGPDELQVAGQTVLMYAAGWNCLDLARLLLDRGVDIHAKDASGKTAVMNAAYAGKAEMVELLVSRGADIHDKDANGKTVLMYAASGGKKEVVDLLTGLGAALEGRTADGDDIRDLARKSRRKDGPSAVEDAFRRVTDEAVNAVVNGLDRPVAARRLQLKPKTLSSWCRLPSG